MMADMTVDTTDKRSDTNWPAAVSVGFFVFVSLIAGAASLMMSFHGLRDLVERVEDVHGWLSNVGPVGIDGLQLASFVAILFTVGAPFKVRLYLWIVFFGSIGLSVLGNALDAWARHAGGAGIGMSAVWPALLAAATHVVVMAIRWRKQAAREATTAYDGLMVTNPQAEAIESSEPKSPTRAQLAAWARSRYATARSSRVVAEAMAAQGHKVSPKDVERWTKDMRQSSTPEPRVNGHDVLTDQTPAPEPV